MTKFVQDELKRLVKLIPETDPRSMEYTQLMFSLESFINHGGTIDEIVSGQMFSNPEEMGVSELTPLSPTLDETTPFEDPVQFEVVKNEEPAPFTEESSTMEENDKTYTLPEVRAKLTEVRQAMPDFKIRTWLAETYSVDNVTALPEGKYSDAMKRLETLLAAKDQ